MGEHHEMTEAPGFAEIQDEAADTPYWLPLIGVGILVIFAGMIVFRVATNSVAAEAGEAPSAEVVHPAAH